MIKQEAHIVKGMQKDLTVSKFSPEYVFDAHNIRLTARENTTLLSISNEKGNTQAILKDTEGNITSIKGTIIGYNVLNNYLTLFITSSTGDTIIRLERKDGYFELIILFEGNLNFNPEHPIESISIFENENIQKVYWIDGLNQPRFINIAAPGSVRSKWTDNSFEFVQNLKLKEHISIVKNTNVVSKFASGVIQYAFSYYNMYGQESNIFYTSSLQYISFDNRGANPEESVGNSFTITIDTPDTQFDYIRIYSIHRTSIDAVPTVINVADLAINNQESITYVDNGEQGSTVDPTELLYIGGESIVAQCFTHKDNTLFLGNIKLNTKVVEAELRNDISNLNITFSKRKLLDITDMKGYYHHQNQLSTERNIDDSITGFHSNEWYRFGLQFQYKTGKWSEPVFIEDFRNTVSPEIRMNNEESEIYIPYAYTRLSSTIINRAIAQGFVRVRGVVVLPSYTDREVIAQGMVCPTVYNIGDRQSNSPFAQASWFSRPSMAFNLGTAFGFNGTRVTGDYTDITTGASPSIDSVSGILGMASLGTIYDDLKNLTWTDKGVWAEFRHNKPIPDNVNPNAEIQCIANPPDYPTVTLPPYTNQDAYISMWAASNQEYFYVDRSIITLHSPDIEFDDILQNMDVSNLKFRIVGRIAFTGHVADVDVQTETPGYTLDSRMLPNFYYEGVGVENLSYHGAKGLITAPLYLDAAMTTDDFRRADAGYLVYPWHRNGPLNNSYSEGEKTACAKLYRKKLSNLKYAAFTEYFTPWNAETSDSNHTGISGIVVYNSDTQSLVRLPSPKNSSVGDINYYGNIDKVVTVTRVSQNYQPKYWIDHPRYYGQDLGLGGRFWNGIVIGSVISEAYTVSNREDGYPIVASGIGASGSIGAIAVGQSTWHSLYENIPTELYSWVNSITKDRLYYGKASAGTEPVSIKYKSTPHAVMAFNYTLDNKQVALPYIRTERGDINQDNIVFGSRILPWDKGCKGVYQDVIDRSSNHGLGQYNMNNYGYLWLGEIYNDNVENRFGGTSTEALENNIWIPAGEPADLINSYNGDTPVPYQNILVYYTEGDTFFQRYDCLKTYPYTQEDQNSVVEIVSFMCETRINIDGRYDKNRGQVNNLNMTPSNFNLINNVYTQKNNFFNYRALNYNKYSLDYFPVTITWTKEKQSGAITDTWTNITMASTLEMDGDKGDITSLNTFSNEIFCFQERGLSNILFNSRVQIPTSDGVPIEITNGLKVNGKRYINNTLGCNNKWSIMESPLGLYFIDNITNGIYIFNGKIESLSDKLGFKQWVSSNNSLMKWTPTEYSNFSTYYDKNNNDVYFVNKGTALVYSELLGQFTSFMDYEKTMMFNINDDFYAIKDSRLWEQFKGDYNILFGEYKPYSITVIANDNSTYDKIFNNLEYRADSWNGDTLMSYNTFDTLEVWNEYQKGISNLNVTKATPSSLKKKFRVWRANIPRANTDWNGVKANRMDRIRNTWAYIKLSRNRENTDRMEFHDLIVHYFV